MALLDANGTLLTLVRHLDPDPSRMETRQALIAGDRAAIAAALQRLTGQPLSPTFALFVGSHPRTPAHVAIRVLQTAQSANVNHFGLAIQTGRMVKRPEDSIACYRAALALRPTNPVCFNNLGVGYEQTGQLDEAITAYREAIRLSPRFALAHRNLGRALGAKGNYDEAVAACREAIGLSTQIVPANDSFTSHAYVDLGNVLRGKRDVVGAIKAYREAARLDPDNYLAHQHLADTLRERGDFGEAILAYRDAIRIKPRSDHYHHFLAHALRGNGDADGAIASFREALRLDPKSHWSHHHIGDILREKGDLDGAVAAFREALRTNPAFSSSRNDLGAVLQDKGDLDGALANYQEGLRFEPTSSWWHTCIGAVLRKKGDTAGAIASLREGVRLDPNNPYAQGHLGEALRDSGKLAEAATVFRDALERFPKNDFVRNSLGEVERWLGYEKRLRGLLAGTDRPASRTEALDIAYFCQQRFNKQYQLAFVLYQKTFFDAPTQLVPWQEYRSACAAVQLAAGHDAAATIGIDEWCYLHTLALRWMRRDLEVHRGIASSGDGAGRRGSADIMLMRQNDPDLAPVRDPRFLAVMPEDVRVAWEQVWTDVEEIKRQARGIRQLAPPPRPKE